MEQSEEIDAGPPVENTTGENTRPSLILKDEVVEESMSTTVHIDNTDKSAGSSACPTSTEGNPQTSTSVKQTVVNSTSSYIDTTIFHYEGDTCVYTDPVSKYQYEWDKTIKEWVPRKDVVAHDYDGDTHTYTDPTDGTVYIWDKEKNAWFPKVDDDFLAMYQMNYGFTDPAVAAEEAAKAEREREEKAKIEAEKAQKRKAEPEPPSWFEIANEHNTKVYVSNLPLDITEQEFVDTMQKCGMVMRDPDTNKMKIKLYTEAGDPTVLKGDALCTYIRIESVDMALKLLDGYEIRGKKISVERAKFQMKGNYDPNLKPKKKRKRDKEKLKKQQEKLFDWRPEKMRGERAKNERVVIVKNVFDPAIFEKDVALILEYQQDLREECSKCGEVRKVVIYDRHPEGVAQVMFSDAEEADICLKLLNGRWFGQRKITAETWDGKTKYKVLESEADRKARLEKWDKFLESEENRNREGEEGKTPKTRLKMSDLEEVTTSTESDPAKETVPSATTEVCTTDSDVKM